MNSKFNLIFTFIFFCSLIRPTFSQETENALSDKELGDIYKLVKADDMEVIKKRYAEFMGRNSISNEADLVSAIEKMSSIDCDLSDIYFCRSGQTKRSVKDPQNPIHDFIFYLFLVVPESAVENLDNMLIKVYNGDKTSLRSLSYLQDRFFNEFGKELKLAKTPEDKKTIAQKIYRFLGVYFSTPEASGAARFCEEKANTFGVKSLDQESLKKTMFKDTKGKAFSLFDLLTLNQFYEMNETTEKEVSSKITGEFDKFTTELFKSNKNMTFTSLAQKRSEKMVENTGRETITIGPDNFVQLFDDNKFILKSNSVSTEFRSKVEAKIKEGYEIVGIKIESSSNNLRNTKTEYPELRLQYWMNAELRFYDERTRSSSSINLVSKYYPKIFKEIIEHPNTTWEDSGTPKTKKDVLAIFNRWKTDPIIFTKGGKGLNAELTFKQLSFFRAAEMTLLLPQSFTNDFSATDFIFDFSGSNGDGSSGKGSEPENKYARLTVKLRLKAKAAGAQIKVVGFSPELNTINTSCYDSAQCVPAFRLPRIDFPRINLPSISLGFLLPSFRGGFGGGGGHNKRFSRCFNFAKGR